MLIKWILCNVPEKKKALFSQAQKQWDALKSLDGFLGQIGGWDINNSLKAGIISFWRDRGSYQLFMDHKHDEIFAANKQKNTYDSISVEIYEKKIDINGQDITRFLGKGKIIRIASCIVQDEKEEYFELMQKEIWNKGMSKSNGMLAGVFCKGEKNNRNKYLVVSLWKNEISHQKYVENTLPTLIEQSKTKEDLIQISGALIKVEEAWSII